MTDDAIQGMLFGSTSPEDHTIDDNPPDELRICALNVNSPNPSRAQRIVDWLLSTQSNALVLTEMQPSDGGRHIMACLQAEGFTTTRTPGWRHTRYLTAVATRGMDVTPVRPAAFDPRIVAVDLSTPSGPDELRANDAAAPVATAVRLVGIYGLTNGMTAHSSTRRRAFQEQLLAYLAEINRPSLCVAGDLNVVEPDHHPHLPAFQNHDYAFYTGLLELGLRDGYRHLHPAGGDHSWLNPRFGNQRLDHQMLGHGAGEVRECAYDHTTRRKDLSDHAALRTVLRLPAVDSRSDPIRDAPTGRKSVITK